MTDREQSSSPLKFDADGKPLPYYGNTIISFINQKDMKLYEEAVRIQKAMEGAGFSGCLAFLPPSSFHVTVLTLCREIDRGTAFWPAWAQPDEAFCAIDARLAEMVSRVPALEGVRMKVKSCELCKILVGPLEREDEKRLLSYRDEVAALVGIRHSWHDGFQFHLTLNYKVRELSTEQKREAEQLCGRLTGELMREVEPFVLPAPEFVIFNDMMSYEKELSKRGTLKLA